MGTDIVIVRVGEGMVDFSVHKDILFAVSRYFHRAWDRSFLGVKERIVMLRDVSEATFRIFLTWSYSQCLPGSAHGDVLVPSTSTTSAAQTRTSKRMFDEYVSGKSPYLRKLAPEDVDKRYHNNPAWHATYQEVVKVLVRLYIFAHKYSIDQLRDDVMSTYMGYCVSYGLYPDADDVEIIELAYKNLPPTSSLSRFFVLTTVYFWTPLKTTLESGKLDRLNRRFIQDVMTAQAQRSQPPNKGESTSTKLVPSLARYGLTNSCVFHEHARTTEQDCRSRMAESKFIFDSLLDACAKEARVTLSKAHRHHMAGG
jgi:hypothetical protein